MSDRQTISRAELLRKIESREPFVLLEALPEPYYRKNHLPGAQHLPPTAVVETIGRLAPSLDAEIVVYCWDDH